MMMKRVAIFCSILAGVESAMPYGGGKGVPPPPSAGKGKGKGAVPPAPPAPTAEKGAGKGRRASFLDTNANVDPKRHKPAAEKTMDELLGLCGAFRGVQFVQMLGQGASGLAVLVRPEETSAGEGKEFVMKLMSGGNSEMLRKQWSNEEGIYRAFEESDFSAQSGHVLRRIKEGMECSNIPEIGRLLAHIFKIQQCDDKFCVTEESGRQREFSAVLESAFEGQPLFISQLEFATPFPLGNHDQFQKDPTAWARAPTRSAAKALMFQLIHSLHGAFAQLGFQHWDLKPMNVLARAWPENQTHRRYQVVSQADRTTARRPSKVLSLMSVYDRTLYVQDYCVTRDMVNGLDVLLMDFDGSTAGGGSGFAPSAWTRNPALSKGDKRVLKPAVKLDKTDAFSLESDFWQAIKPYFRSEEEEKATLSAKDIENEEQFLELLKKLSKSTSKQNEDLTADRYKEQLDVYSELLKAPFFDELKCNA